jgi:protein SCO1
MGAQGDASMTRRSFISGHCDEHDAAAPDRAPQPSAARATAPAVAPRSTAGATRFANITLTTHTGEQVSFYDDLVRGRIVAINMMYAECTQTCPVTTANLVRVQQRLGERAGRDVFMYSVTLKPEQDSADDLRAYAERHGVKPGWSFLTGSRADIERLRYRLGFYDTDPAVDRRVTTHTGMLRVGNDSYDRWTMTPALASPEQILSTINHVVRGRRG